MHNHVLRVVSSSVRLRRPLKGASFTTLSTGCKSFLPNHCGSSNDCKQFSKAIHNGTTVQQLCNFSSEQEGKDRQQQQTSSLPTISDSLANSVSKGDLRPDKEQSLVAQKLSRLQRVLLQYDNSMLFEPPPYSNEKEEEAGDKAIRGKEEGRSQPQLPQTLPVQIPRGLYIYGDVGTGKTMLMDMFYSSAQVERKQRFHFHAFLAHVHSKIHSFKQQDLVEKGRNFTIDTSLENNPIYRVGLQLSSNLSLLCLDEFQVTDIADAVILSQLFRVLFWKGTVVVATSNRPPSDLYEGGMNRGYFLPFIDLLQHHCIVHCINSKLDYRNLLSSSGSFFLSSADEIDQMSTKIFQQLEGGASPRTVELDVGFQRNILLKEAYGRKDDSISAAGPRAARFSFNELCEIDWGAMEYRAIAKHFDIVVLGDIPHLSLNRHNVARRFITLIDELYEGRCALLCSSEASDPKQIFHVPQQVQPSSGEVSTNDDDNSNHGDVGDIRDLDLATTHGGTPIGALASVRELAFAFQRASSRLVEMTSESWWNRMLN